MTNVYFFCDHGKLLKHRRQVWRDDVILIKALVLRVVHVGGEEGGDTGDPAQSAPGDSYCARTSARPGAGLTTEQAGVNIWAQILLKCSIQHSKF